MYFSRHFRHANNVGYQEVDVPAGQCMRTATFKAVSGNYKISDIKVSGALGQGSDMAQKVGADGKWGDLYMYLTLEGTYWLEDGWYKDLGGTPVTDEDTINVGEALYLTSASDITYTFSGEVIKGQPTYTVAAGQCMVGNPTPVNCKISEIEVTGAMGQGSDMAQMVGADGKWGNLYMYLTLEGTYWLEDGWYKDLGGTPVTDEDYLQPGESLYVTSAGGMVMKFKQVLAE